MISASTISGTLPGFRAGLRSAGIVLLLSLSACSSLKLPSLPGSSAPPEAVVPGVEPSTAAIARVRAVLLTLRSDPDLSSRVQPEIMEAETALQKADAGQHDKINGVHLIYLAERKVEYARSLAELRALEVEYQSLRIQRDELKRASGH